MPDRCNQEDFSGEQKGNGLDKESSSPRKMISKNRFSYYFSLAIKGSLPASFEASTLGR